MSFLILEPLHHILKNLLQNSGLLKAFWNPYNLFEFVSLLNSLNLFLSCFRAFIQSSHPEVFLAVKQLKWSPSETLTLTLNNSKILKLCRGGQISFQALNYSGAQLNLCARSSMQKKKKRSKPKCTSQTQLETLIFVLYYLNITYSFRL